MQFSYLVLIRYCAKFIDSGVPEMATALSLEPSSEFEILIVAPESCLNKQHIQTLIEAVNDIYCD
jgi:hypothetical protein